ncbi:hypothetical protein NFHSH190041_31280 [Shewanella sp. NFH-SH190041]|nr:hypothetical protein NFHSH190041_31280 [Shewanella sp. NFH-SH190041]
MTYCVEKIENILEKKLIDIANDFGDKELKAIDIGVFPWHETIELSLLFSEDNVEINDIAAWPYFNYSEMNEGGWDEAKELANNIAEIWEQNKDVFPILLDFATAATAEKVTQAIGQFNRSPDFFIQVLNPDDHESQNFCDFISNY